MTADPLNIEFDIDDEYRRALIRSVAATMKLAVVEGPRPQKFSLRVASAEQAYGFGIACGFALGSASDGC